MAHISFYEQQSRNTIAISILNLLRRRININENSIYSHKDIVLKSLKTLENNPSMEDFVSYYFRDSGNIENSATIQIGKVLKKILNEQNNKEKFISEIKLYLNDNDYNTRDSEKKFLVSILEKAISSIDYETQKIEEFNTEIVFDTKGF